MTSKDNRDALFSGELGALMLISYVVLGNNAVTHRWIEQNFQMPVQAWSSLYAAARFPGIRAKEIATLFPRPQNTISRALALLEARGWIHQETSETDKREKHVFATEAGLDALVPLVDAARRRQEELFSPLTTSERQTLMHLIGKIAGSETLLSTSVMTTEQKKSRHPNTG